MKSGHDSETKNVCSYHVNALVDQLPEIPGNKINCSAVNDLTNQDSENKAHIKVICLDSNGDVGNIILNLK